MLLLVTKISISVLLAIFSFACFMHGSSVGFELGSFSAVAALFHGLFWPTTKGDDDV